LCGVLNSRVLRKSLVTFSALLCSGFFAGSMTLPAFAAEPSYTLPPFACEVRYHFREHFRHAKPGEKSVSAPSFEREALPTSHVAISDGVSERIVEGRVAHLPYHFSVKISRGSDRETGTLQLDVLDSSGKSLTGFPQVMPNPLTKTGDSSRKEFELPVEKDLKKKIKKTLLAQDQFLTHVDLIVGMDNDFLSADFPN
jgi:hypothetical protein